MSGTARPDTTGRRELAKAYGPPTFEARDLRALAGGRRLRARRRRLDRADPAQPPFVIIQPPPNVTGSLHLGHAQRTDGRGPDDPPCPDAAATRRSSCRASTTPRSPPSSSSTGSSPPRARAARASAASATSSGCASSSTDPRGDARPAAPGRRVARLGPAAVHDGRGLGAAVRDRLQPAVPRGPRLPDRGAHQLVPRLPDERLRPRGRSRRRRPARSGRSATTSSTRRPASPTRRRRSPSPRPGRRRSSATPPSRSIPTIRATRRSSGGESGSRSSSATCRSSPTRRSTRRSGPGGQDHARPRPRRLRDGGATTCRSSRSSTTTPMISGHRHAYAGSTGTRRGARIVADLDGPRRPRSGANPHEMVIGRCQRSNDVVEPRLKTQWFIRTTPLAEARPRGDPVAAGRGSCPSDSRRSGSTG